ncbi:hypothetical protein EII11_02190 [Schaalia canis]|uniref:Uncharacterized protein n=1 Tax=Schaalia canis TaxID=100469 RepID=A0A3P1SHN2_9ACTO|nr:hypothetical protein EII11_02190 [Schaalia canis]
MAMARTHRTRAVSRGRWRPLVALCALAIGASGCASAGSGEGVADNAGADLAALNPSAHDHTGGSQSGSTHSDDGQAAFEEGQLIPPDILGTDNVGEAVDSFEAYYRAQSDYYFQLATCMEDKGWPRFHVEDSNTPNVGVVFVGHDADPKRYTEDFEHCQAHGPGMPMPPEVSVEVAEKEYEKAKSAHACLVAHGANLPEFPSKQTFFDYFIGKQYMWDPAHNFGLGEFDHSNDPVFGTKPFKAIYEMCPW